MNVATAFLDEKVEEEIHVQQPIDKEQTKAEDRICKQLKAL
jgi:hypothetical protein